MNEWNPKTLGELLGPNGYIRGPFGSSLKRGEMKNSGIAVYEQLHAIYNTREFRFYIDEKKFKELARFQVKTADLIISCSGTVGKISIISEDDPKGIISQALLILRPEVKNVRPVYLKYFLTSELGQYHLLSASHGSVQPNIAERKIVQQIPIDLPSVDEQDKIIEVLSSLDDKIDLLHRNNKTLEQLAETLFRQWFVEEVDDSWEISTLGRTFDIGIGRTPPRKEQEWFSLNPVDIKWVSIKDMGLSGIYIDTTAEYLTQAAVDRFSVPVIPENTVMLSFKMTIGRLAITTEKMLSNEAIAHFKIKPGSSLFPEFLYLYLKTYRWEQLGSTSSIVEAINSQMIKEMELVIPDKQKLIEFQLTIETYFNKIKRNQSQLKILETLRDTLLPKLMSGTVIIQHS